METKAGNHHQAVSTLKSAKKSRFLRVVRHLPRPLRVRALKAALFFTQHRLPARMLPLGLALIIFGSIGIQILVTKDQTDKYNLDIAESRGLIDTSIPLYSDLLAVDTKSQVINYNQGYIPAGDKAGDSYSPKITATFQTNDDFSVSVTDPVNEVAVSLTPKFKVAMPEKIGSRVVYPIVGRDAAKVYSVQGSGVKEDIVVYSNRADRLNFTYELGLPDGLEARLEKNGSVAVYGINPTLLGNINTGSEKDAELLKKARQNAVKDNLMFTIPAPVILEGKHQLSSAATAWFELSEDGRELTIKSSGLKNANYPLTIDPSIYVETAAKLMRGNNETNTDFDVDNELIQKSQTTGARIDAWQNNLDMTEGVWGHATAAAGGYIYRTGGRTGATSKPQVAEVTNFQTANSSTFNMNMPTNRPAGDLYIAVLCHDGSDGGSLTYDNSWTLYADLGGHAALWKIGEDISGGNEASSYGFGGYGTEEWAGAIMRITGFNSGNPVSPTPTTGSGGSGNPVFPAITPDNDQTLIVRAAGWDQDDIVGTSWVPSGHTSISYESSSNGGNGSCGFASASMDNPPAGGVSSGTATMSGINDDYGSSSIAINPIASVAADQDGVNWAKFNSSTLAIESPNPGAGPCSGWCTDTAYDLPQTRKNHAMVAYNGYLYVIGGQSSSCSGALNACSTVYIAKLGANGEPSLWHPTDSNKNNWDYWYASSKTLSTERRYTAAVAYNNRIYLLGGQTNAASTGVTTVESASVGPTGDLGNWTTTGMQALPAGAGRFMHTAQTYNDTIYTIGGFEGAATSQANLRNAVWYSKLNSDGTMNPWVQTSSFATERASYGGDMSAIWGAYIYLGGGCTDVNGSGYCTTVASDMQLASINADGSLAEWNTILNLSHQRIGYTFASWQGGLYRLGGCQSQDASTGECGSTLADVDYGVVNPSGEASTVANSSSSGNAPCSGGSPYSCDLPSASVGNMLNGSIILNGYLYIMGGCTSNACTSYSNGVTYQAVGSDGTLQRPASCSGSYTDSYCVSSISLPNALGAPGITAFNNRIYLVGGFPTITNISYTLVNSDGSINSWSNTDFTDIAVNGVDDDLSYTFAYARANPSAAGSVPGNLFIFGGCTGTTSGIGCSSYSQSVYKCNLSTTGAPSNCTITGQTQIGTVAGASGSGLGAHAGAVYANYIYLMGGLAPGITDLVTVYIAKFDDNNNVVESDGAGTAAWTRASNDILVGRRRGAGFGYNGYLYVTGGYDGTDALADIEFAKIDVSTGDIDVFLSSSVSINKRWGLTAPVSNSYAYIIGGCIDGAAPSSCNTRTNSIQTFQIYNNDSGAIQSVTSFSDDTFAADTDRWGASAAVLNGYIYVAGGCISATDCTNATSNVQYAAISTTDGSIGTWATASNVLPADRAWGQLEVAGGYLYYLGGQDDTQTNEQSTVYYVGTFSSGNVSAAWQTASGGIGDTSGQAAQPRTKFGSAVWNNRIYVVGGLNGSAAVTNTVFISPQLNSGGDIAADSWTSDADVPDVARFGGAVTTYANNLYLFGGNDGTNYLNDSQFTQINSDGTVDAWTFSTSLPGPISQADAFAANGYMYVIGGRSGATACAPSTMIAPMSANTTIVTGNNPTGVGEWYQTNVRYAGGRYGPALAYSQGKLYLMGGGCTSPQAGGYSTGTITQSGTTVTGSGTSWTDNLVGGTITYNDASTATVVSVSSATSMVVSASKTIGIGQTYSIAVARHQYSTLKSQPQVAKYSRLIDTDTNVFPNSWLLNGLDNSIGARWQARYQSAIDASNVVYQDSFDNGTSGNPLNDSGSGLSGFSSCFSNGTFTQVYDNSWSVSPSNSVQYDVTNSTGNGGCHATYTDASVRFERFYLRLNSSAPSTNTVIYSMDDVTTGSGQVLDLQINTSGNLRVRNNFTLDSTLTLDTTSVGNRIEVGISGGNATVRVFRGSNINGTTPDATATFALSSDTVSDDSGIGILTNGSNAWNWWVDDYKASQSDWVGPAFPDWGQMTNVGDITLGDVMPYVPRDASGNDTAFARYYFFFISIDASQTFGYPEDVNRGPTITDLSLFFTSDPGKRLRHGKTFTGGELQPLDTPCGQSVDADCPNP